MRIVVTGGAGFIGANTCRGLLDAGIDEVVVLDDLSTGSRDNLTGLDVALVEGSLTDAAAVTDVVAGADAVIHLAARPSVPRSLADPMATHDVNGSGTMHVLEAARAAGAHVLYASSSSVYGDTEALPKHEDLPTRPLSPYGASKLAGESYVLAYGRSFGLPVLPFRFFNVYGPLQAAGHAYAAVVPTFVDAALRGRPLPVHGDGGQTRDFTYVGTVVRVLVDAVVRRVTSDVPVNLAFGTRCSLTELVGELEAVLGQALPVEHLPTRAGDIRDSQAAQQRLRALFPEVEPVPLATGLERTVAWFRESAPAPA